MALVVYLVMMVFIVNYLHCAGFTWRDLEFWVVFGLSVVLAVV